MVEEDKLLTTALVGKRFGLSERTIIRHIERKLLPAVRLTSRQWVIKESDLVIYVKNVKKIGGKVSQKFLMFNDPNE
jgi:hypothetical protein